MQNQQKTVSCKKCGEYGLHWEQDMDGRWKLFNPEGTPHVCSLYDQKKNPFEKKEKKWFDK